MLDIDGFRIDKATQITVDMLGDWSDAVRRCARRFGKRNFFIPGEIGGADTFGSIYLGRGRQPDMRPANIKEAFAVTTASDDKYYIRGKAKSALDAGAFHYSAYRALTRFLGLDGNFTAPFDTPVNWVDMWNSMAVSNDMVNVNTGELDPRHMFGVSNQDVFRWPAIKNGEEKMLLGLFITTLVLPGIPHVSLSCGCATDILCFCFLRERLMIFLCSFYGAKNKHYMFLTTQPTITFLAAKRCLQPWLGKRMDATSLVRPITTISPSTRH
jgi:glycosidase